MPKPPGTRRQSAKPHRRHSAAWRILAVSAIIDLMKRCDPLEHAVTAARKHGLEIVIYTTLFDESIPTMQAEFNFTNPQFCWKHRQLRSCQSRPAEFRPSRSPRLQARRGQGADRLWRRRRVPGLCTQSLGPLAADGASIRLGQSGPITASMTSNVVSSRTVTATVRGCRIWRII